ncbi:MAG TPA: DUF2461 domain-containing protein [Candidatus Limnocylindrales bacterium]|jgi:uncharacterized protein (TIGR02453 family)|nr:DUF2461 domain-containing protein [Candidatus Limnocylindrales bacterium]
MSAVAAEQFTGFRPEAVQFLADLGANNDRSWFQPRKGEYERLLKEPLEALCAALAERFTARGVPLRSDPARSPFRIYRDVRFSRDKSPYKTNIGASFPWIERAQGSGSESGAEDRTGVGGYFHFAPGEVYVGGGMWHPEPARLAAFRRAVGDDPSGIRAVFADRTFREWFDEVEGDRLKRVPSGFPPDHPEADLLRLKDVVFGRRLSDAECFSPALPDLLADAFEAATPALRFLARLKPAD